MAKIEGTIVDDDGQGVADAIIILHNEDTQFQTTTASNTRGHFRFTPIAPGTYKITVEKETYDKTIAEGIQADDQQSALINLTLRPKIA